MEKQIITISVVTEGDTCQLTDEQIRDWYKENVSKLFNPEYGTPKVTVSVTRTEL